MSLRTDAWFNNSSCGAVSLLVCNLYSSEYIRWCNMQCTLPEVTVREKLAFTAWWYCRLQNVFNITITHHFQRWSANNIRWHNQIIHCDCSTIPLCDGSGNIQIHLNHFQNNLTISWFLSNWCGASLGCGTFDVIPQAEFIQKDAVVVAGYCRHFWREHNQISHITFREILLW